MTVNLFLGYDSREQDTFKVAVASAQEHTYDSRIHKLEHRDLRRRKLFRRPWLINAEGQYFDAVDGKPFSTEFSHTRFLVPTLAYAAGIRDWAIFADADFLFRADLEELHDYLDSTKAVYVVPHGVYHGAATTKMDGMAQQDYPRKLWSSLIVWNLRHPANLELTSDDVNTRDGSWLHGFKWLLDSEIGFLPKEWNYLVGIDSDCEPKAVHFTLGSPEISGYEDCEYAEEWRSYL